MCFSLGMTLYELVSGGKRPFHMAEHQSELEAAILRGDPLQPITNQDNGPWPDMEELIGQCVQQLPDHRPTVSKIQCRLKKRKIRDLLQNNDYREHCICAGTEMKVHNFQRCRKTSRSEIYNTERTINIKFTHQDLYSLLYTVVWLSCLSNVAELFLTLLCFLTVRVSV